MENEFRDFDLDGNDFVSALCIYTQPTWGPSTYGI